MQDPQGHQSDQAAPQLPRPCGDPHSLRDRPPGPPPTAEAQHIRAPVLRGHRQGHFCRHRPPLHSCQELWHGQDRCPDRQSQVLFGHCSLLGAGPAVNQYCRWVVEGEAGGGGTGSPSATCTISVISRSSKKSAKISARLSILGCIGPGSQFSQSLEVVPDNFERYDFITRRQQGPGSQEDSMAVLTATNWLFWGRAYSECETNEITKQ